jgi:transposase-like protein
MNRSESVNQTYARKFEDLYRRKPASLIDVVHRFGSEELCRDYLEKLRWPDGKVTCPRCESDSISEISTRHQFDCNKCRMRFSVTSGTIFDNTKLPLWKWLAAAYMMLESKKSVSANQLKRTLGVTYKTAWFLCHRIREAMETPYTGPMLFGIVEVDETLLAPRNKRWPDKGRRNAGIPAGIPRVWVVGAVQRGGEIRLGHVNNVKRETLHAFINKHVRDDCEAIYTDELRSYLGIADTDTKHQTVNHSANEWVGPGDVHTNSIESAWALFERALMGAFHKISVKHLDAYLQEIEFRHNNRHNQFMFRDLLKRILTKDAIRYEKLTA